MGRVTRVCEVDKHVCTRGEFCNSEGGKELRFNLEENRLYFTRKKEVKMAENCGFFVDEILI